jgi:hypothetical protein
MDYKALAKRTDNANYKEIFELIGESQPRAAKGVLDASPVEMSHSADVVEKIKGKLFAEVQTAHARDGSKTMTLAQAQSNAVLKLRKPLTELGVKDDFFNVYSGAGTGNDPSTYNAADVPMMMGPWDSTALYSSGGIPKVIVDKKVNGVYSAPSRFTAPDWERSELDELGQYMDAMGLHAQGKIGLQDSLIYGGDMVVPAFDFDNALTYELPFYALERMIKKDSLQYLWTVDRWNCVVIPRWNVSVQDYLTPDKFYVPIAGKGVHTSRAAVIKVQQLPYWAAIRQLGWNTSDMVGYTSSCLAYNMAVQAMGMMMQQSSLLYMHTPLDGLLLQNGPDDLEAFIQANNEQLRNWSIFNPKTLNTTAEIKMLDRTYAGFTELVMAQRQDIAARADLPESDIFSTQAKGFSDNTNEVTIKKAQIFKTIGDSISPAYKNITRAGVLSLFGPDSKQAKLSTPKLAFEQPIVQSNDEKMKSGAVFFGMLKDGFDMGMKPGIAMELAKQFAPELDIPASLMAQINAIEIPEEPVASSETSGNKKANARKKKGGGEDT